MFLLFPSLKFEVFATSLKFEVSVISQNFSFWVLSYGGSWMSNFA